MDIAQCLALFMEDLEKANTRDIDNEKEVQYKMDYKAALATTTLG